MRYGVYRKLFYILGGNNQWNDLPMNWCYLILKNVHPFYRTALRTIGIPGRTITNFNSAHDADANCLLDYHFDADGNPLDNDDSVW